MKISFDFDDTLSSTRIQSVAKECLDRGHDVWIVTARPRESMVSFGGEGWNDDLYMAADYCGIAKDKIHFCNLTPKYKFFISSDFNCHLDDDLDEWSEINKHTSVRCFKLWDEFFEFSNFVNNP